MAANANANANAHVLTAVKKGNKFQMEFGTGEDWKNRSPVERYLIEKGFQTAVSNSDDPKELIKGLMAGKLPSRGRKGLDEVEKLARSKARTAIHQRLMKAGFTGEDLQEKEKDLYEKFIQDDAKMKPIRVKAEKELEELEDIDVDI